MLCKKLVKTIITLFSFKVSEPFPLSVSRICSVHLAPHQNFLLCPSPSAARSDPWGISAVAIVNPQNLAVESTSRAGEPQRRKARDRERATAKMPSLKLGEPHSLPQPRAPRLSSPGARQAASSASHGACGHAALQTGACLPTPCER